MTSNILPFKPTTSSKKKVVGKSPARRIRATMHAKPRNGSRRKERRSRRTVEPTEGQRIRKIGTHV